MLNRVTAIPAQATPSPRSNGKTGAERLREWLDEHPKTRAALKGAAFGVGTAGAGLTAMLLSNYSPTAVVGAGALVGAPILASTAPPDPDHPEKKNRWAMATLGLLGGIAGGAASLVSAGFTAVGMLGGENFIPVVVVTAGVAGALGGVLLQTAVDFFTKPSE